MTNSMTAKQISRVIQRDPDLRALRMCEKYLFRVCTPRMRRATLRFLTSKLDQQEREAHGK